VRGGIGEDKRGQTCSMMSLEESKREWEGRLSEAEEEEE
jgi:hypothetical protein